MVSRPCALVLLGALLVTDPAAAGGIQELDKAEMEGIAHLAQLGRVLEAQCLLKGRLPHLTVGDVGTRYNRALSLLPLARLAQDRDLEDGILAIAREDGLALAALARATDGAPRTENLANALRCLSEIAAADAEVLYHRGWCHHELASLGAARADLAAAVEADPRRDDARGLLARTLWRLGQRRPAVELVVAGLRANPGRENSALLASMLRFSKRKGHSDSARSLALRWSRSLNAQAGSPLKALLSEIQIENNDLAGAMDTFGQVQAEDRPWLLGGVVRAARAQIAQGESGQAAVLAAINRLPLENVQMPAPLLKLSGDIAMQRKDTARALRHYAAAVTGGEGEALELADHARAQGAPIGVGAMAEMLSGHVFAYKKDANVPAFNQQEAPIPTAFFADPNAVPFSQMPPPGGAIWNRTPHDRAQFALWLMKSSDRAAAIQHAARSSTPVPARQEMLRHYLSGDIEQTKRDLDAFSLVSWQVLRPGVVGMLRQAPPGSGAENVEPVKQLDSAPPALEVVGEALAALKDPNADEEGRLAKLMEVAGQRTPETERLGDPVAIDMDGNGQIDITSRESISGSASFDLDGWGNSRQVQWLSANHDAWLCEDTDHDGRITSGHELFGTAGGFTDGFEKLARRDRNDDGRLTGAELTGLSVWSETGNPGVVDDGELVSVEQAGVTAISIPRVGLRTSATVHGTTRLCAEIWPEAITPVGQMANGGDLDLEGI